jgi:hypothetical protein
MRPGVVVVLDVGENADEVPFAADQEPVQALERALDTYRSAYAFGAVIGIRMISLPSALNTVSKPATKLGVPVADEEPWRAPVLRQQH